MSSAVLMSNELIKSGNAGYNLSKAGVKVFTEQRESLALSQNCTEIQSPTSSEVSPQTAQPIYSCMSHSPRQDNP
jgi:hypothetical protein